MLNQPSNISPDEINGSGCVDISQDMDVSWQVSGDSPMSAYQITLYKNDTSSTKLYSTGKTTLSAPWWGVNYAGDTAFFAAQIEAANMSAAGMANGNEYKMLIVQWFASNDAGVLYTAAGAVNAGQYYFRISDAEYAVFTLDQALATGDSIRYSTKNHTLAVTASGFFYTLTVTRAAEAAGTELTGTAYSGGDEYVLQTTPALFLARSTPTLAINAIPSPVSVKEYSFTATYSQAQGDSINWVRWRIADKDDTANPFVDTGKISGTGELRVDYNGFLTGNAYSIQCTVETANGVSVTTGWVDFNVSYTVSETTGNVTACQLANEPCVYVKWTPDVLAQGYTVLRRTVGDTKLKKLAYVGANVSELRDYSAKSGESYVYYVFPEGALVYLTTPMVSNEAPVQFWFWAILETEYDAQTQYYNVVAAYFFRYGKDGVSAGSVSNNNTPTLERNFTRYPTRQPDASNYLAGTLSGFIGGFINGKAYKDTVKQFDALMALSNSDNTLFLLNPKGHFLRIHTASATAISIDYKSRVMPQTGTISWAEVGSTDGVSIVSADGSQFYPTDNIVFTTITIDPATGRLLWTTDTPYENGSVLSLNEDGALIQTANGSFTPASMALDADTGTLTATVR